MRNPPAVACWPHARNSGQHHVWIESPVHNSRVQTNSTFKKNTAEGYSQNPKDAFKKCSSESSLGDKNNTSNSKMKRPELPILRYVSQQPGKNSNSGDGRIGKTPQCTADVYLLMTSVTGFPLDPKPEVSAPHLSCFLLETSTAAPSEW